MTCYTCRVLKSITYYMDVFVEQCYTVLLPNTSRLFIAFFGCWLVYTVIMRLILKPEGDFRQIVKSLAVFICIGAILKQSSPQLFMSWVYEPLYAVFNNIVVKIIGLSGLNPTSATTDGMLEAVENELFSIGNYCSIAFKTGGWIDFITPVIGMVLMAPYLITLAIFTIYVAEFLFKLNVISGLAPLFIAALAFPNIRGFSYSGLKVILQGGLTLVISVTAMMFSLHGIKYTANVAIESAGTMQGENVAGIITSPSFLGLFVVGLLALLFQLKAATISSNLTGSSDGPGAAGAVASYFGGSMILLGRHASKQTALVSGQGIKQGINALDAVNTSAGQRGAQGMRSVMSKLSNFKIFN